MQMSFSASRQHIADFARHSTIRAKAKAKAKAKARAAAESGATLETFQNMAVCQLVRASCVSQLCN